MRGPRAPLARTTWAVAAQDGSEDDGRSRLRPDALPFRRFVFGQYCRLHARIRDTFARASVCVEEMPFLYLLPMPLLYLLASLLDTSLGVIPVVGTSPEFDSLWEHQPSGNDV